MIVIIPSRVCPHCLMREAYDERSRVFPHPPTCRRQQPRRVTAMRAYPFLPYHSSSLVQSTLRALSRHKPLNHHSSVQPASRAPSLRKPIVQVKTSSSSSSRSPRSTPYLSSLVQTMLNPRYLQQPARQPQTARTLWPCCPSSTAWTPPSTPG